jgi:hypothetical protein
VKNGLLKESTWSSAIIKSKIISACRKGLLATVMADRLRVLIYNYEFGVR